MLTTKEKRQRLKKNDKDQGRKKKENTLSTKKTRKVIKENDDHERKKVRLNLVFLGRSVVKNGENCNFSENYRFSKLSHIDWF